MLYFGTICTLPVGTSAKRRGAKRCQTRFVPNKTVLGKRYGDVALRCFPLHKPLHMVESPIKPAKAVAPLSPTALSERSSARTRRDAGWDLCRLECTLAPPIPHPYPWGFKDSRTVLGSRPLPSLQCRDFLKTRMEGGRGPPTHPRRLPNTHAKCMCRVLWRHLPLCTAQARLLFLGSQYPPPRRGELGCSRSKFGQWNLASGPPPATLPLAQRLDWGGGNRPTLQLFAWTFKSSD